MTNLETLLRQRLSQVEASHARLLNHLPGMAYRCRVEKDYDYTMVFASQGCDKLLGLSENAIMLNPSNTVERLTVAEDLADMRRAIHEAVAARRSYQLHYRVQLPSGEEKWIWDQGEGVFDQAGNCVFLEGIMMDVTEQKTRELGLKRENRALRKDRPQTAGLGQLIGDSPAMRRVYDLLRKAAGSDTNVMLYGETGVGKDLAARTLHELANSGGRFVPVNCAAIPEQLLESEFFGHVKGAFSGAVANRTGYLAAADKGTLFLDEIGELPLSLQAKLLRALESKTYTPVGSNEVRKASFRLISATNKDLAAMVRQKAMRADFFFRVHVLTIALPPLRERKEDLPLLAAAYARERGIHEPLPERLLRWLAARPLSGNVRELQNILELYWAFGRQGLEGYAPGVDDASPPVPPAPDPIARGREAEPPRAATGEAPGVAAVQSLAAAREDAEKQWILAALELHGWKIGKTAEALGLTMRTFQRRLKKYGIDRRYPRVE